MELRRLRKEMRMTQKEFADMLGLTQGYLSELETGKSPITQNILNALKDNNLEVKEDDNQPVAIPIMGVHASAGAGVANVGELIEGSLPMSERFEHHFGNNVAIIAVTGDSMEPTISHQDWLLVRKQTELQSEGIFVFLQDNELRVKRIQKEMSGRVLVISDNPKYQMESYDFDDESFRSAVVVGRVVGIIQKA